MWRSEIHTFICFGDKSKEKTVKCAGSMKPQLHVHSSFSTITVASVTFSCSDGIMHNNNNNIENSFKSLRRVNIWVKYVVPMNSIISLSWHIDVSTSW
jgi:hypothetical protein